MATDGVKIIDGDTAYDVYNGIMDLYDAGASVEVIKNSFQFPSADESDEFEYEIYATAWVLAMWEIGAVTSEILAEVRKVIDKDVCAKVWAEEMNEKTAQQRRKVLEQYWAKISQPNAKVRKRKKYKKITSFIFEVNDILAFNTEDGMWHAAIVLKIDQHRSRCSYYIGHTTYHDSRKPNAENVADKNIWGHIIPHYLDYSPHETMSFEAMQAKGGYTKLLRLEALRTGRYVQGLDSGCIDHKELVGFRDKFEVVGSLPLATAAITIGSFYSIDNFEKFQLWWKRFGVSAHGDSEQFSISAFIQGEREGDSLPILP